MTLTRTYEQLFTAEGSPCRMPPLRERRLLREILKRTDRDLHSKFSPGATMCALLTSFLPQIGMFTEEQVWLIVGEATQFLYGVGEKLECMLQDMPNATTMPGCSLAIADRKYVTWELKDQWLSLETGQWIARLPKPPMETLSYHLFPIAQEMLKSPKWVPYPKG